MQKEAFCTKIWFIRKIRLVLSLIPTLFDPGYLELELKMGCIRSMATFARHGYYNHVFHALF